jgi:hypothetical protein
VITPASPNTADTISFVAPTADEMGLNSVAAADQYGNPILSVDLLNRIVSVSFTPPLDEPIPNIAAPVSGVDGQFGPLQGPLTAGTWTFEILTNSYTFTVVPGPPLPPTATVEWHSLGLPPNTNPAPTSFVISPANPSIVDIISFVAPAEGEGGSDSAAAADKYGNPAISIDATNHTVAVTFSPPADEPVGVLDPVSGVDGQIGPLEAGTWAMTILTNTCTINVAGLPLSIAPADNQVVVSWTASASNYVLQAASDLSAGSWSTVTNGISTNGNSFVFTNAVSSRAAYFRLQQQ